MEDEGLHYPPGAEPDNAAKEAEAAAQAAAEAKAAEEKAAADAAEKVNADDAAKAEEEAKAKADAEAKAKAEAEAAAADTTKKRSIYDDLKEKKREAKEATARAEAAEAKAAELQALLEKKDGAETPAEKKEAKDAIEAFAEREGLKPESLRELTKIIVDQLPKQPSGLTEEEAAEWRADRAKAKAAAEDQAILSEAPKVKEQLAISDDTELATVMKEIVRLAHTKDFHDKEIDYIVWKNKDALAKMVSPKKPSFEQGGQRGETAADADLEFSGKTTPGQAEKALSSGPKQSYEFRRSA